MHAVMLPTNQTQLLKATSIGGMSSLPDHFTDSHLLALLAQSTASGDAECVTVDEAARLQDPESCGAVTASKYPLCKGLAIVIHQGVRRLSRRSKLQPIRTQLDSSTAMDREESAFVALLPRLSTPDVSNEVAQVIYSRVQRWSKVHIRFDSLQRKRFFESSVESEEREEGETVSQCVDYDIYQGLPRASTQPLEAQHRQGRAVCSLCTKSRAFYCCDCLVPVGEFVPTGLPFLTLPVQIHIIHHPKEIRTKSTGLQAKLIAPNSVNVFTFPDIPQYDKVDTFVLYPGEISCMAEDIVGPILKDEEIQPGAQADRIAQIKFIIVESTWQRSSSLCESEQLKDIPRVRLGSDWKTTYWRTSGQTKNHLSSIEAIFRLVVEIASAIGPETVRQCEEKYCNLLWFYSFQQDMIKARYDSQSYLLGPQSWNPTNMPWSDRGS